MLSRLIALGLSVVTVCGLYSASLHLGAHDGGSSWQVRLGCFGPAGYFRGKLWARGPAF